MDRDEIKMSDLIYNQWYKKLHSSTTLKTCDASNEKSGNISRLNKNNTNLKNFLNFLNLVKPKLPTHQTTSPDWLYP